MGLVDIVEVSLGLAGASTYGQTLSSGIRLWTYAVFIFRLTPSRPNKAGLKCPSVRPSTKSLIDFNEIWYVGRGRRVMHDGMQYDPIQGHGQGHEPS